MPGGRFAPPTPRRRSAPGTPSGAKGGSVRGGRYGEVVGKPSKPAKTMTRAKASPSIVDQAISRITAPSSISRAMSAQSRNAVGNALNKKRP